MLEGQQQYIQQHVTCLMILKLFNLPLKFITTMKSFIYNHKPDLDSWILMHYIIIFLIKNSGILVLNLRI